MAGCPLAAFLANVYLSDLDWYFYGQGILYGRYSDDIILFADSEQEVKQYASHIRQTIGEKHLVINPDKENFFEPHQPWNFLGMVYCDGVVDISPVSAEKLKQKMKRKSSLTVLANTKKKFPSLTILSNTKSILIENSDEYKFVGFEVAKNCLLYQVKNETNK